MVSSRDMENRRSFQTTMKSRGLPSRVAWEIILVNSSRLPGVSLNVAETVRPLVVAVVATGCLLVIGGDAAAAWRQGGPDVDRGLWHGLVSWGER